MWLMRTRVVSPPLSKRRLSLEGGSRWRLLSRAAALCTRHRSVLMHGVDALGNNLAFFQGTHPPQGRGIPLIGCPSLFANAIPFRVKSAVQVINNSSAIQISPRLVNSPLICGQRCFCNSFRKRRMSTHNPLISAKLHLRCQRNCSVVYQLASRWAKDMHAE